MSPEVMSTIIGTAGATAGGGLNAITQGFMNRRSRKWSLEMWNRQNAYNTPAAQMQRFRDAGLNPMLMYSQGSGGLAPAVPDAKFENPRPGDAISSGAAVAMSGIYDLEIKKEQANNLKLQADVLREEALLKKEQQRATRVGSDRGQFDLDFESEFRGISGDARRENLRAIRTQTDVLLDRNVREAAMNASNLQEAAQRIINLGVTREHTQADINRLRANMALMQKDGILKDLEIKMREAGLNPNSPLWSKVIGSMLSDALEIDFSTEKIQDMGKRLREGFWNWLFD